MSGPKFVVKTHCIEGQYKRQYRQGLVSESAVPKIQIKQYVPINNQAPSSEGITIIAAGGNGFIKEAYEPFFEEFCSELEQHGQPVRSIWIADVYTHGASALENSTIRGNDPGWWDHSRDLLHMINVFRNEMTEPLVGLGHSMGAAQIAYLSTLHPRLFTSLVLIEAQIHDGVDRAAILPLYQAVGRRREHWPSRSEAEKSIRKSPFYANWDPRAVDRLVEYSLATDLPADTQHLSATPSTQAIRDSHAVGISTTTPRDMEVGMLARLNLEGVGQSPHKYVEVTESVPDLDPNANGTYPFYRPESMEIYKLLPSLRPSVLWICSADSTSSRQYVREHWLHSTGTGVGGSGGARAGQVSMHVFDGDRHTLPMDDKLGEVAQIAREWLQKELVKWSSRETEFRHEWESKSLAEKQALHPLLKKVIKEYDNKEPLENFVRRMNATPKL